MKTTPLLLAILVAATLYMLVFERDTLAAYAQANDTGPAGVDGADEPPEEAAIVRVVAMRSVAETVDSAVVLRGRTEAAREVQVASETSGQVISEPLRKGATVRAGDIMCELDPGTRQASLAEARARLAEAQGRVPEAQAAIAEGNARLRESEINLSNVRRLSGDGFASETQLISAEAAFEAASAGLSRARAGVASAEAGIEAAAAGVAAAEREIVRLTIRAPFGGILETDTAELGSLMQPGTPCATIIQLNPIKLVGFVPEVDVNKVEVGALAGGRLTSGQELQGMVSFVSRRGDDLTRTFRVEIEVPNPDLGIRDGQTADIVVASDGQEAHLIPQSALTLNDDGALGVRTVDVQNVTYFAAIDIIRDTVDGVWVTGLGAQTDIITVGQEFVIDGVTVDPHFAGEDAPLDGTDTEASE